MIRRGDTVQVQYDVVLPTQDKQRICARAEVKSVDKKRGIAVLSLWNGRVSGSIRDQYSDQEIPLADCFLVMRKKRKKTKWKNRHPSQ